MTNLFLQNNYLALRRRTAPRVRLRRALEAEHGGREEEDEGKIIPVGEEEYKNNIDKLQTIDDIFIGYD